MSISLMSIDLDVIAHWKFPWESVSHRTDKNHQYTANSSGASVEFNHENVELGFSSTFTLFCLYL